MDTGQTVSISPAGKFGMLLFDGVVGHRTSINFTNVTIPTGTATLNVNRAENVGGLIQCL